jgi:hypothetical protein
MKVLLDHDLPKALRLEFAGHLVLTARQMGWEALSNGRLIAAAEFARFDVLITADQRMYAQQSHADRQIALIVLTAAKLTELLPFVPKIREAVDRAALGGYERVAIPRKRGMRNPADSV